MDLGLRNKRVLVTGGSGGIGAAIARGFLGEGAKACIVSRGSDRLSQTEKELVADFGSETVVAEACDCTQLSSLQDLRDRIQTRWQGLDIVIANIGDGRSIPDPIPDNEQWKKTWSTNFESALNTASIFLPMLRESKGCLLFVSSIAALEAFGAPVDYATAKSAVSALAKNMARKLAKEVRVNVLAPGNVYFPGGVWDEKIKQDPERVREIIESMVPMNRFGTPDEMASAVLFLCSERAEFITGSTLVVDGGQTVGAF